MNTPTVNFYRYSKALFRIFPMYFVLNHTLLGKTSQEVVTPPTLGLGVLTFFFKSWDETDRVSPENLLYPKLKVLH